MCHLKVKSESHHMHGSDHDSKTQWNQSEISVLKPKRRKKKRSLKQQL